MENGVNQLIFWGGGNGQWRKWYLFFGGKWSTLIYRKNIKIGFLVNTYFII